MGCLLLLDRVGGARVHGARGTKAAQELALGWLGRVLEQEEAETKATGVWLARPEADLKFSDNIKKKNLLLLSGCISAPW